MDYLILDNKAPSGYITEDIHSLDEEKQAILEYVSNLENCKEKLYSTLFRYQGRKGNEMAIQRHKVCIGKNDDNTPIYRWLQAKNDDELNDKIVREYVNSGRIWEFMSKKNNSLPIEEKTKQITLKAYTETWMDTYKRPKLKPTTLRGYDSYLCAHIYPVFGDKSIGNISTSSIQRWLNDRKQLGKATLKKMLDLLKQILDYAKAESVIKENPANNKLIVIPSDKVETREALTLKQVKEILSSISTLREDDRKLMALLLLTGCRRGEVLGLRWEDIDLAKGLINIRRNVTYEKNQPFVGSPKTEKGKRQIPLDPQLLSFLQPLQTTGFIIGGGETPISNMSYRRQWERIEKAVDLYGATAHVFRHSYLTILASTGIDVKTLQAIGGHADIQTTMNRYVHPVTANIIDAGNRMNSKLLTSQ